MRGRHGGFTLIEILVVMVIIAIVISFASVNFFRDDKQLLHEEAERLALLLEHARDEAVLTGKAVGWSGEPGKYYFLELDSDRKWIPRADDGILRERQFKSPIVWKEVRVDGAPAKLSDTVVVFSNAGLNQAFDITLELSGNVVQVQGDPVGHIKIPDVPFT
jgi:general secretion pathway protein H